LLLTKHFEFTPVNAPDGYISSEKVITTAARPSVKVEDNQLLMRCLVLRQPVDSTAAQALVAPYNQGKTAKYIELGSGLVEISSTLFGAQISGYPAPACGPPKIMIYETDPGYPPLNKSGGYVAGTGAKFLSSPSNVITLKDCTASTDCMQDI
jgi:hypothetical protein